MRKSQASSEHAITFATVAKQAKLAKDSIEGEFQNEYEDMCAVDVL